jgi:hypothetical protein
MGFRTPFLEVLGVLFLGGTPKNDPQPPKIGGPFFQGVRFWVFWGSEPPKTPKTPFLGVWGGVDFGGRFWGSGPPKPPK